MDYKRIIIKKNKIINSATNGSKKIYRHIKKNAVRITTSKNSNKLIWTPKVKRIRFDHSSSSSSSSSDLKLVFISIFVLYNLWLCVDEDRLESWWSELVESILIEGSFKLFILFSFFHFMRLFWNQIFICLSVKPSEWAISMRLLLVKYLCNYN